MVGLDCLHRLGTGLDDVRVNGTLAQELDTVQLPGLLLEDTDKLCANDLPLLLRIGDPSQLVQKTVHGVHVDQVGIHLMAENIYHLLRLALAQETVIDMDTGELLANGFDEQGGHHGGVHAAREGQEDLFVPHLLPDELHLVSNEVVHVPVGLSTAQSKDKVGEGLLPLGRVGRPGLVPFVIGQEHGNIVIVDVLGNVNLNAVYHSVRTTVENNALHIGESLELFQGNVVGMDLAVNAKSTDLSGQTGIFLAAQVQYKDHVLLHCSTSHVQFCLSYHIKPVLRNRTSGKVFFCFRTVQASL